MWLSEEIATAGKDTFQPRIGYITKVNKDKVTVKADGDYKDINVLVASGINSMPCVGDEVVVFPMGESAVCSGLSKENTTAQNEEIYISNSAGAYVWLKKDGAVVINGHVFNKEV